MMSRKFGQPAGHNAIQTVSFPKNASRDQRVKNLFVMAVVILASATTHAMEWPRLLFPTSGQIDSLKADGDWGGMQAACSTALKLESRPVADFSPPPHYDRNGPRAEAADSPVAALRRESLAVYRLSICFEISRDPRFSSKAESILDGWANTTRRIGTLQGADAFNFYFSYALMGAYALRSDAGWQNDRFNRFVKETVVPANNADKQNNHGNWGVLLLATAGAYLRDEEIVAQARRRWSELLRSQVASDGSLPLEICRSDTSDWCGGATKGIKGLAYTHYALHPTVIAAEVFRNLGQSPYASAEGSLLCKAYERAALWTLHPEEFPYYKSNHGKLVGVEAVDYFFILEQRCHAANGALVLDKFGAVAPDPLALRSIYSEKKQ